MLEVLAMEQVEFCMLVGVVEVQLIYSEIIWHNDIELVSIVCRSSKLHQ